MKSNYEVSGQPLKRVTASIDRAVKLLILVGFCLTAPSSAHAVRIYEYTMQHSYYGNPMSTQEVFNHSHSGLHTYTNGVDSLKWVISQSPATVEFYVNEQTKTLERFVIKDHVSNLLPSGFADTLYQNLNLSIDVSLSAFPTTAQFNPNSPQTGLLGATVQDMAAFSAAEATAVISGSEGSTTFSLVAKPANGPGQCSVCLLQTNVAGIEPFHTNANGTVSPIFSTWLALMYLSGPNKFPSSMILDVNAYLHFSRSYIPGTSSVPEPASATLLASSLIAVAARRRRTK